MAQIVSSSAPCMTPKMKLLGRSVSSFPVTFLLFRLCDESDIIWRRSSVPLLREQSLRHHLLCNRKDVIGQPVEDEARGKIYKQKGHKDRQEQHNFGLGRIHGRRRNLLLNDHCSAHDDWQDIERVLHRQVFDPQHEWSLA